MILYYSTKFHFIIINRFRVIDRGHFPLIIITIIIIIIIITIIIIIIIIIIINVLLILDLGPQ